MHHLIIKHHIYTVKQTMIRILVIDGYLKYKYENPILNEDKISTYKKNKNTIVDDILVYNYQKFTNGQLTLAIISLIMFNYNIISK